MGFEKMVLHSIKVCTFGTTHLRVLSLSNCVPSANETLLCWVMGGLELEVTALCGSLASSASERDEQVP